MPVQINITGDNANQAHQEFMNLHTLMSGGGVAKTAEAPATAPTTATPIQAPTQQQDYSSFGQTQQQWPPQQQGGVPVQQQYGNQPQQQYGQQPQQGYGQQQQQPVGGSVPTSTPSYTLDQLGVASQPVVDAGRGSELIAWLQQHGVTALTALHPQHYGEFATYLRSLGAKI